MRNDQSLLSVGVIGTGGMGARHARNLHNHTSQANVAAIMDVDLDRARSVAAECGGARVFDDAEELIRADDVQAVVIASPDATHPVLTLECLRQNKPVLCEKPLARTAADAKDIVEAESQLGRRLVQVGFMRQYDPRHVAVKNALDSGSVGRPIFFSGWHRNQESYPGMTSELVVSARAFTTFTRRSGSLDRKSKRSLSAGQAPAGRAKIGQVQASRATAKLPRPEATEY